MKTLIRPAALDDLDLLMDMGEAFHQESPRFSRLKFSRDKVLNLFITTITQENCLLLVAERDDLIVGAIAATVCPHWFSEELMATEFGVFILPEHRGGMTAVRLIKAYIAWAEAKEAKMIEIGTSTGIMVEETVKLYTRIGLKKFAVGFEFIGD